MTKRNRVDIAATRGMQQNITSEVVLYRETRSIEFNTTVIMPTKTSNR